MVGEVLFDNFPDYQILGGAPFNVACHLKMLGVPLRFFSRIGKDSNGEKVIAAINKMGLNADDMQIDPQQPTGVVTVQLDNQGIPQFMIEKNAAYDFLEYNQRMQQVLSVAAGVLYFGTLAQRTDRGYHFHQQLISQKNTNWLCFYDINLRPDCYHSKIIINSLKHTDILKLNDEELQMVADLLKMKGSENELLEEMQQRFSIQWIALTKGAAGSKLLVNSKIYQQAADPVRIMVDTVGAGDAYAALLIYGILQKWLPEEIIVKASRLSAEICTIPGAFSENNKLYKDLI